MATLLLLSAGSRNRIISIQGLRPQPFPSLRSTTEARSSAVFKNSQRIRWNSQDGTKSTSSSSTLFATNQSWSEEWKRLQLGAKRPISEDAHITNLLFVQTGFGVDQHGDRESDGATKAAVRAVRNAIEFNSIPGVIEAVPGGRHEMLIQVLLGVPPNNNSNDNNNGNGESQIDFKPMDVDLSNVAKVLPYGRLLPIQVVIGGLAYPTGRIVTELGDQDDNAICVVASVSIGYDNGERQKHEKVTTTRSMHKTYNTKDGF